MLCVERKTVEPKTKLTTRSSSSMFDVLDENEILHAVDELCIHLNKSTTHTYGDLTYSSMTYIITSSVLCAIMKTGCSARGNRRLK